MALHFSSEEIAVHSSVQEVDRCENGKIEGFSDITTVDVCGQFAARMSLVVATATPSCVANRSPYQAPTHIVCDNRPDNLCNNDLLELPRRFFLEGVNLVKPWFSYYY